ncbi:uncharacterized protein LOC109013823 isoform X1 [Juglans regia]|uniref:Uncharacterized protein LOC109013823 isoform X1 n=1 Tax=Juglans regia TaxID=51240 RepID=A0A6P9EGR9_JUGRE|nr:uncharacterized protein LOC109013823 isoform X1 [Juglans regia]
MAVWTGAAYLVRHSSSKTASSAQAAFLLHRRGLARGGDHQGPPKVNFWQDPLHPSRWKEEHFVIVSLAGWGLLFYGGYKFFTKGKKNKKRRSDIPHIFRVIKLFAEQITCQKQKKTIPLMHKNLASGLFGANSFANTW